MKWLLRVAPAHHNYKKLMYSNEPGERNGNPLQYSCLENPHGQRSLVGYSSWGRKELDTTEQLGGGSRRRWQRMRWLDGITYWMYMSLSKLQELVRTGRPGVLQSMGLQRVGHNWATELNWTELSGKESACQAGGGGSIPGGEKISCRRKWQPTPVFLPGKSMDRGDWRAIVHGVAKSQTWLSY